MFVPIKIIHCSALDKNEPLHVYGAMRVFKVDGLAREAAKCKGNCSKQEQSGALHVRGLSGALYAKWTRPAPAGKVAAPLPSSTLLILRFEFKSLLKNKGMCK